MVRRDAADISKETMMHIVVGMILGSLLCCSCINDAQWNIPRLPYAAVLAVMLLCALLWG